MLHPKLRLSKTNLKIPASSAIGAVFASGLMALCLSTSAQAEVQNLAIGLGVNLPTPLGTNYDNFTRATGVFGEITANDESLLGNHLNLFASAEYQPYNISGQDSITFRQFQAFVGVETRAHDVPFFIKPYFGLGIGVSYDWLNYTSTVSNATANSALSLAGEVVPGILIPLPLLNSLSINYEAPISCRFKSNSFGVLNQTITLRWAL